MERLSDEAINRLANAFPSLDKAQGLWPWNPVQFDIWANDFMRSANELHSARFLLTVWNRNFDWDCGYFDPQLAIRCWDRAHRWGYLGCQCPSYLLASSALH